MIAGLTVYLFENLSQSLAPIIFRDVIQSPLNTSHKCSGHSVQHCWQHLSGAVRSNTLERSGRGLHGNLPFYFLRYKKRSRVFENGENEASLV